MTNTSAASSKTRERLIDVARQLFTRNGVENTTMSDIASASSRGRRTIYTYFRTKRDIYEAVIQSESAKVCGELQALVDAESTPELKLRKLMEFRINLARHQASNRPEVWLSALFRFDSSRGDRIRAYVRDYVLDTMDKILAQGVADGTFDPVQASRLPRMLAVFVLGNDWAQLSSSGDPVSSCYSHPGVQEAMDFIIDAITIRKTSENSIQPQSLTNI
ncbi:MAG: TetR/AcrR family transcriptional regulator [Muribaculaceae bacterium]|nr:TetR/AcrR family transcriptional regulator [Muribaculaceae bacterium]